MAMPMHGSHSVRIVRTSAGWVILCANNLPMRSIMSMAASRAKNAFVGFVGEWRSPIGPDGVADMFVRDEPALASGLAPSMVDQIAVHHLDESL